MEKESSSKSVDAYLRRSFECFAWVPDEPRTHPRRNGFHCEMGGALLSGPFKMVKRGWKIVMSLFGNCER